LNDKWHVNVIELQVGSLLITASKGIPAGMQPGMQAFFKTLFFKMCRLTPRYRSVMFGTTKGCLSGEGDVHSGVVGGMLQKLAGLNPNFPLGCVFIWFDHRCFP
jgi:hypothetical protein